VIKRYRALAVAMLAAMPFISNAADYPDKPVRLVVPFAAGSSTDAVGRVVAQVLAKSYGQPFVVDNKPGALATLGAAEVAKARPDGYTLLLGSSTSHGAAPSLFKTLPYSPEKSFVPIGRVAAVAFVLAVRPELPVRSVAELIAYGKKAPKPLAFGYANSANQVAGSALVRYGQFPATDIAYKGVGQIITDMLGGDIDFTIADTTSIVPQIKSGKLRALAVTSEGELPDLPGVPPLGATVPDFKLVGWYGVFAPAGTPEAITADLAKRLQAGMKSEAAIGDIHKLGLFPFPSTGPELGAFVASETAKWGTLIKAAGIEPQ
jgi:tripartite-type tricarboxylate transporter receptor subunit TctC